MSELQKYVATEVSHPLSNRIFQTVASVYISDEVDARLALMQRAIEWCLENGVHIAHGFTWFNRRCDSNIEVPTEFAEFIKPKAGETK